MTDAEIRKKIASITDVFADSRRGIMITDKNLRRKWTNDIDLAKGKITKEGSGYTVRLINQVIPLQMTEITIAEKKFYLFFRYDDEDMLSFMRTELAERVYCLYATSLRNNAEDYRCISKNIADPLEAKRIKDDIERQNTKLLSGSANCCELMKLINSDPYHEPCCLTPYLKPFLENAEHIAKANGFDLSFNLEKDIFLRVDIKVLRCVISNLIVNAFMYNKSDIKKARLDIFRKDDNIYIEMTDNGGGMDEQLIKLTEKPYSISHGGEGLGLYFARQYAKSAGGTVTIENKDGGLKVSLELPPKLEYIPDEVWAPPYIPYPILIDPEYLILAKGMDTVEGGCF